MHEIIHLDEYVERTILSEAAGGKATQAFIVAPTIVALGQSFSIGVSLLDRQWLPCAKGTDRIVIKKSPALRKQVSVRFEKGSIASCRITDASFATEGLYRIAARWQGKTVYSNPILCTSSKKQPIWWGDPHIHTVLSDCHPSLCRSPEVACAVARDVYFLDWVSLADHVSNGRTTRGKWRALRATEARHENPGVFSVLPSYEASLKGNSGGDNNIYFLGSLNEPVDEHADGNIRTLCEKLGNQKFFTVPHHTSRVGKHGAIPYEIYPGADKMPLVEIHSKWGTSEFRGNPTPLYEISDGPVYAQDLLAQGYHMGFIGGTDAHSSLTFGRGKGVESFDTYGPGKAQLPGITAIHATSLDKQSVFQSMANRRCYAAAGERIYLDVSVAGKPMGTKISCTKKRLPKQRTIKVVCAGRENIKKIEIIRNGTVVHTSRPSDWKADLIWTDDTPMEECLQSAPELGVEFAYYYVRVTFPKNVRAWSSPVRIETS